MRVFVAIELDTNLRENIAALQNEIKAKSDLKNGGLKWTNPASMHLTLKFLGEIPPEKAHDVCRTVENAVTSHKPFELEIKSVGHFGGKRPRVFWIGTGRGAQPLAELQQDVENLLADAGWPPEKRKFTGHLTLCRTKKPKAADELRDVTAQYEQTTVGTLYVESVTVFQSQLTPHGPVYTVLGSYKLQ